MRAIQRCLTICCMWLALMGSASSQTPNLQDEMLPEIRLHRLAETGVEGVRYFGKRGLRAARLHEFSNLKTLSISYGTKLTQADIDYLATLTSIVELEFGFVGMSSETVEVEGELDPLKALVNLERLSLSIQDFEDRDLAFIATLPKLIDLEFKAGCDFPEDGDVEITDGCAEYVGQIKSLRSVCIYSNENLSDHFVEKLTRANPNLEHFEITAVDSITDESLRFIGERCPNISWLDIDSDRLTDAGVGCLAKSEKMEMLWLRSKLLTSNSVMSVSNLKQLQHLELTVSELDDAGMKVIAELPNLEVLALREPLLTDRQFGMLQNHSTLKSSFLNGTQLSVEPTIGTIESLPAIEHLEIRTNDIKLSQAVKQTLLEKASSSRRDGGCRPK